MSRNTLIDITDQHHAINTSESYSKGCYFYEGDLLIPYMNIDIIEGNLLGFDKKRFYFDFSYLILTNCSTVRWYGGANGKNNNIGEQRLLLGESNKINYFGMMDIEEGWELKISFDQKIFLVPEFAKMSNEWFSPWDTPNFKRNIASKKVDDFSNLRILPDSINRFKSAERLNFYAGAEKEIEMIKSNW